MPAQLILARLEGEQFKVKVHLDTAKTFGPQDAKQPDPDWLYEETHPQDVDPQATVKQALKNAQAQLKAMEAGRKPPELLPDRIIEGQTFDLASLSFEEPPPKAPTEAEAQQPHPHVAHPLPGNAPADLTDEHPGTGDRPAPGDRTRDGRTVEKG